MFNLQQPVVWIAAVAAVVLIGGVGLWLRRRMTGGAAQDPPMPGRSDSASSLANLITTSSANASAAGPQDIGPAAARPEPASLADKKAVVQKDGDAGEDSRPKKSAAAKKAGRKKPAPRKASQKKPTRKK